MGRVGLLPALVIGASLVLAALVFALAGAVLNDAGEGATVEAMARLNREIERRDAEIAALRSERDRLAQDRDALQKRLAAMPAAPSAVPAPSLPTAAFDSGLQDEDEVALVDPMELAKGRFNRGVIRPTPAVLREVLGEPRASYSQDCQPVTDPGLAALLETRRIAGFEVTMVRPALDSLEAVMERLRSEEPQVYAAVGTAGALCARYVRGSASSVSSHAWGAAVDLTLSGHLDQMGDAATQSGLVVLAEFFNDAGWYWGAGYGREDSMHFEVGEGLLRQWQAEGKV